MGKQENNGKKRETSMVLDLSDFVTEVDRFSRLIEPFALAFYLIDDIRRLVPYQISFSGYPHLIMRT